jgi:hypothetical protein
VNNVTHTSRCSELDPVGVASIITSSIRCWREACDAKLPVQPHLYRMLEEQDCTILAPVFDSLFCFYEAALKRPIAVGGAGSVSEDERLLLSLVDRPALCRSKLDCPRGAEIGLNCALCSTRIMLSLAMTEASIQ